MYSKIYYAFGIGLILFYATWSIASMYSVSKPEGKSVGLMTLDSGLKPVYTPSPPNTGSTPLPEHLRGMPTPYPYPSSTPYSSYPSSGGYSGGK